MVRESAVSADETAMKRKNCAASPAPRKAASAAASAPTPNQSSTKPGVKTSAMTSTTPSTVHRIHVQFSLIEGRPQPLRKFFITNQTLAGRSASRRMKYGYQVFPYGT